MNAEHYDRVKNIIQADKIGIPQMVRIYRGISLKDTSKKEALEFILYEDLEFMLDILGEPDEIYSKTVDFYNTIIIMKHKNKSLSHISVNFYDIPAIETFRIEAAGTKGLTEYDSDKESIIFYPHRQNTSVIDLAFKCENERNRKDVLDIISIITKDKEDVK